MMGAGIIGLGRRFARLERRDRWLVVEAVVLIGIANAGLRTVSFVSLRRMLDTAKQLRSRSMDPAPRISWAIGAAAQVVPGRTCLKDALAADVMLCRRGYPSTLRLGVKKGSTAGVPLEAHAWVESEGAIVAGQLAALADYQPFP